MGTYVYNHFQGNFNKVMDVDDGSEAETSLSVPRKLQSFSFSLFFHLLLHCQVSNQLLLLLLLLLRAVLLDNVQKKEGVLQRAPGVSLHILRDRVVHLHLDALHVEVAVHGSPVNISGLTGVLVTLNSFLLPFSWLLARHQHPLLLWRLLQNLPPRLQLVVRSSSTSTFALAASSE